MRVAEKAAHFTIRLPSLSCGNGSPPARVASALSVAVDVAACKNQTRPSQQAAWHPERCGLDAPLPLGRLMPFTNSAIGKSRGSIQWTPDEATSTTAIVSPSPSLTFDKAAPCVPGQTVALPVTAK